MMLKSFLAPLSQATIFKYRVTFFYLIKAEPYRTKLSRPAMSSYYLQISEPFLLD